MNTFFNKNTKLDIVSLYTEQRALSIFTIS